MNHVTIEIWMWIGNDLGKDFESLSEMRSRKKESVEETITIRQFLDSLARRYPPIAREIFNIQEGNLYSNIVVIHNDKVISPYIVHERILEDGDKITILPMYAGG